MGKNITEKKGKGKQLHLPYDIKAVGKNIMRGRGTENLGKKFKIKNVGGGNNIKLRILHTTDIHGAK